LAWTEQYDLGFLAGKQSFVHKPSAPKMYPVHMELNDWAKHELSLFCTSFIEEHEEDLERMLRQSLHKPLPTTEELCRDHFQLCLPPSLPPPPRVKKKSNRMAKARAVFASIDKNGDGALTLEELLEHTTVLRRDAEYVKSNGRSWDEEEQHTKELFTAIDSNSDGDVSFSEYIQLWPKNPNRDARAKSPVPTASSSRAAATNASPAVVWQNWMPLPPWLNIATLAMADDLSVIMTIAAVAISAGALVNCRHRDVHRRERDAAAP